jgi:uncharacterized membrane protein HdeD (DUF308 family)
MKLSLLKNWHLMRIIRLVFGIFLIFQGIETREWFFFIFAAFFLFQGITNQGCGINGNCTIPEKNTQN